MLTMYHYYKEFQTNVVVSGNKAYRVHRLKTHLSIDFICFFVCLSKRVKEKVKKHTNWQYFFDEYTNWQYAHIYVAEVDNKTKHIHVG